MVLYVKEGNKQGCHIQNEAGLLQEGYQQYYRADQQEDHSIDETIPYTCGDNPARALFPGKAQPLAIVYYQQRCYQQHTDRRALSKCKDNGKEHEEAELAQDISRCRGTGRHVLFISPQRQAHRKPQYQEFTQEKRYSLAAQGPFQCSDRRLCLCFYGIGVLVKMQESIAGLHYLCYISDLMRFGR